MEKQDRNFDVLPVKRTREGSPGVCPPPAPTDPTQPEAVRRQVRASSGGGLSRPACLEALACWPGNSLERDVPDPVVWFPGTATLMHVGAALDRFRA